jgi:hypothetical protein
MRRRIDPPEESVLVKIDKAIPLPRRRMRVRTTKYPLAQLEVGESFFMEGATYNQATGIVQSYYRTHGQEGGEGRTFTIRKLEGGFRIWRVR